MLLGPAPTRTNVRASRSDHARAAGQRAQLRRAGPVFPADQKRQQVMSGGVVPDQLRCHAFGVQQHVHCGCVVALLGVGPGQVEADLTAPSRQPRWKQLHIEGFARFHRGAGVTERDRGSSAS